ncbi:SMP-30/gluconolactonase/LRE family protein [Segetibacter koreensis]|uniref:SMP-30/gluconolactonase/LRE family protein n=1 Tax=Segetibacter koreensis TaxID=398037 RepID=UPI00036F36F6|nr:SMP-30/gluconolactonase/LRE family protein [Segetibacter koreensis]
MNGQSKYNVEVVVNHTCLLGEGPVWDIKNERILWVDILRGDIHAFYPGNNRFETFNAGKLIGSIALRKKGGLIAALEDGFAFIDLVKKKIEYIDDPEAHLPENRFNDGKCDPMGRFWAGTMSLSEKPQAGSLYTLEKEMAITKKIDGVTVSNGIAFSNDHSIFYYIDSPTSEVVSYDFDKRNGNISNKKTIITIKKEDGYPDGMTIDNEGMLWIAHWDGWRITRWNPATGEQLEKISLPVARVTSCTFGGTKLSDLYITTARKELTEDELEEQPLAGSLFVVRNCGFTGLPAFEFGE